MNQNVYIKLAHDHKNEINSQLAHRLKASAIGNICLIIIFSFATQIWSAWDSALHVLPFIIFFVSSLRLLLSIQFTVIYAYSVKLWTILFSGLLFTSGTLWGVMVYRLMDDFGRSHIYTTLSYLLLGGICASSSTTLAGASKSLYTFLFISMGIPLIHFLKISPHNAEIAIPLIFASYFIFLSQQHRFTSKSILQIMEKRELIESIFDSIPGYVFLIDKDLNYKSFNKKTHQSATEQNLDPSGKKVGFSGNADELVQKLNSFIHSQQKTAQFELPLANPTNGVRWHLVTVSRVQENFVVIVLDIHDSKTAADQINEQKARAEYSAKMASLGEMAGAIAHEINNPLTIVQGKADQLIRLLSEQNVSKDKVLSAFQLISNTSERIAKIIRGLRKFSRSGDADPMEMASLSQIIKDTLELCGQKFKNHGVQMIFDIDESIQFECRSIQISQVLLNLFNNAFDAIKNEKDKWIRIQAIQKSDRLELSVTDSGPGIADKIRSQIMLPFFTTKDVGQGTGLGLSISSGIIKDHSGQLYLDEKSKQTRFVAVLPYNQEKTQKAA